MLAGEMLASGFLNELISFIALCILFRFYRQRSFSKEEIAERLRAFEDKIMLATQNKMAMMFKKSPTGMFGKKKYPKASPKNSPPVDLANNSRDFHSRDNILPNK